MHGTVLPVGPAAIDPGLGAPDVYAVGLLFVGLAVLVAILALSHQRARAYSASIVYLASVRPKLARAT